MADWSPNKVVVPRRHCKGSMSKAQSWIQIGRTFIRLLVHVVKVVLGQCSDATLFNFWSFKINFTFRIVFGFLVNIFISLFAKQLRWMINIFLSKIDLPLININIVWNNLCSFKDLIAISWWQQQAPQCLRFGQLD